jgi:hypothetical protein
VCHKKCSRHSSVDLGREHIYKQHGDLISLLKSLQNAERNPEGCGEYKGSCARCAVSGTRSLRRGAGVRR